MSAGKRRRCPDARNATKGRCEAPGCDHYAGSQQRVCRCCLRRVSIGFSDRMYLVWRYSTFEEYVRLENEALAHLSTLTARPGRIVVQHYFPRVSPEAGK